MITRVVADGMREISHGRWGFIGRWELLGSDQRPSLLPHQHGLGCMAAEGLIGQHSAPLRGWRMTIQRSAHPDSLNRIKVMGGQDDRFSDVAAIGRCLPSLPVLPTTSKNAVGSSSKTRDSDWAAARPA